MFESFKAKRLLNKITALREQVKKEQHPLLDTHKNRLEKNLKNYETAYSQLPWWRRWFTITLPIKERRALAASIDSITTALNQIKKSAQPKVRTSRPAVLLQQNKPLIPAVNNETPKPVQPSTPSPPPVMFQPTPQPTLYVENNYKKFDIKRKQLQIDIERLLKEAYPADNIAPIFINQMKRPLDEQTFFEKYAIKITDLKYPELCKAVADYKKLMDNSDYKEYLKLENIKAAKEEDKANKHLQQLESEREQRKDGLGHIIEMVKKSY